MHYPIPLIDAIKLVFQPSHNQTFPPNNLIETKLDEMNNALYAHETQITDLVSFSELYTQKYLMLKHEYEQKILDIEKTLNDQLTSIETQVRILEAVNQNLFTHVI